MTMTMEWTEHTAEQGSRTELQQSVTQVSQAGISIDRSSFEVPLKGGTNKLFP